MLYNKSDRSILDEKTVISPWQQIRIPEADAEVYIAPGEVYLHQEAHFLVGTNNENTVADEEPVTSLNEKNYFPEDEVEEFNDAFESEDTALIKSLKKYFGVSSKVIRRYDWVFARKWGARFKDLVAWAAKETDLNPGLLAVNLMAETSAYTYLQGEIDSFTVGTDDFFDKRNDLENKVAAYKKINWSRPDDLTNVNENGRVVKTVIFKTGKDAALASAVYLKHGEEILKEESSKAGKNFQEIPFPTKFALLRLAFNAGLGRARKNLSEYFSNSTPVLILKPQKKSGPQRHASIHTAQAIYISEQFFNNPLNVSLLEKEQGYGSKAEYFRQGEASSYSYFENLIPAPVNPPTCSIGAGLNKIGFEFDLLYSITDDLKKTTTISDKKLISHHVWDDPITGALADGFKLTVDGNKIEVATKPFELNASGKTEMEKTFTNIAKFINALKSKVKKDKIKVDVKADASCADCPVGKGLAFKTTGLPTFSAGTVNENSDLKILDEFITTNHFIFPLKFPQRLNDYYTPDIDARAVPQATLGIPLSSISKLTDIIKASEGDPVGSGLTGNPGQRLGLRSDALFNAQFRVKASRAFFLKRGSFNGVTITETNYSPALTGFLILLLEYLWTTVLPVDNRDREVFSKAYIPLHSKIRFREMFHCLLTNEERELFVKVYWEDPNWKNLFSLTKKIPGREGGFTKIDDTPDNILFPPKVVLPKKGPTWHDFVKSIVENDFSIEDTDASGNQTLVTGPTSALKLKTKAVIVELRRMGFGVLASASWQSMATRLFDMAVRLNT